MASAQTRAHRRLAPLRSQRRSRARARNGGQLNRCREHDSRTFFALGRACAFLVAADRNSAPSKPWRRPMTADTRVKRRLQFGDYVRKRGDGEVIGIVVHIMKDAGLIVVNFPPS